MTEIHTRNATTYTDTNLDPETEYFYRVFVYDMDGLANGSNEVTAATRAMPNYALEFDGRGDYVEIMNNSSLNPLVQLTLEAWIKPQNSFNSRIISKDNDTSIRQYEMKIKSDGKLEAIIWTSGGAMQVYSSAMIQNDWQHVAVSYNGSVGLLFINGVNVDADTLTGNIQSGNVNLYIGRHQHGAGEFFKGIMDEVRISNIARYTSNFTPRIELTPDANTVGLWHFNEGEGDTAHDSSEYGNDGLIHGARWVEVGR